MRITKDYDVANGVVILTLENPPLPTTRHTIVASALADGTVSLEGEIERLTELANGQLAAHLAVVEMLNE